MSLTYIFLYTDDDINLGHLLIRSDYTLFILSIHLLYISLVSLTYIFLYTDDDINLGHLLIRSDYTLFILSIQGYTFP